MGRGTKVHTNSPGHMTKMAVKIYYMVRTGSLVILKRGMVHEARKVYRVYINDYRWLTLA